MGYAQSQPIILRKLFILGTVNIFYLISNPSPPPFSNSNSNYQENIFFQHVWYGTFFIYLSSYYFLLFLLIIFIQVCEVYRLHRESFYLAADFVDRYLAAKENVPKTKLQLIGITSLFVAAKLEVSIFICLNCQWLACLGHLFLISLKQNCLHRCLQCAWMIIIFIMKSR